MSLVDGRKLPGLPAGSPILTCEACGAVAAFDYRERRPEEWQIRYRRIPPEYPFAALRLGRAGWLDADSALDISTEIFVQRQRLQQVGAGDLAWLKPSRLTPPPPLMTADETVYLCLKPASYCESAGRRFSLLGSNEILLDSGTLYVTDSKIHLLGQRRDRSQRLSEIRELSYSGDIWTLHIAAPHFYKGYGQANGPDAELIVAIIQALITSA